MPRPWCLNAGRALAGGLLLLASGCEANEPVQDELGERPEIGLMGTIPVYWGESDSFGDLVDGRADEHWARKRIERHFAIVPLDALTPESLSGLHRLMLAQPRALSPVENVALDAWVRAGGHLLLFADPMLTGKSRYAIGDRRRPQDVILLSPILDHWGLRLEFDVEGARGPILIDAAGLAIPVNRPGALAAAEGSGCDVAGDGILARCRLGEGEATVLADAAVLDLHDPPPGAEGALDGLMERTFAQNGEIAGQAR